MCEKPAGALIFKQLLSFLALATVCLSTSTSPDSLLTFQMFNTPTRRKRKENWVVTKFLWVPEDTEKFYVVLSYK